MSEAMSELAKAVDHLIRKIANERKMDPADVITSMSALMVTLAAEGAHEGKIAHAMVGMIGMISEAASEFLYSMSVAEDQAATSQKH